jgi:arylsulfatase
MLMALPVTRAVGDALRGAGARKPNIILILTDDQGYGDLGRNGNPILKTPNLDRMYDEGRHFEDFHVSPTCSPTRASIMTGRHEFKNGVTHTILERERLTLTATTLPKILTTAGYTTGIFGKWHLGDEDAYQPGKRGFDEAFIHGAGGIGQTYPGSCGDAPGNTYFDPVIRHNGKFVQTRGFCTDVFFEQATRWMEGVAPSTPRGKPFFLYIATNAPHVPLSCPDEYVRPYEGLVSKEVATYFGMIANIDANVGKLRAKVRALGIEQNTLVIFMNDNGGFAPAAKIWNAGMRGTKNTAFNGGSRAMSLWCMPGTIKAGGCDRLTAHLDLFPTLAEIAGAKVPHRLASSLDGYSLVPLLKDPQAAWHNERVLVTHIGRWGGDKPGTAPVKFGECSVRNGNYHLVREGSSWRLYDLEKDPGETGDVSSAHSDVVEQLSKRYDAWWEEVRPLLVNEDAYLTAPKVNPFKAAYWKQYRGAGPNNVPPPVSMSLSNRE